jgi:hypothetical protein
VNLSTYKWKNRLLLVFAPPASEEYEEQLRLLEGLKPEFEDRDLLLGRFLEGEVGELDGAAPPEDAAKLRNKFRLEPDSFAVLLVGKDSGEKFRSHEPVSSQDVLDLIDAMPMRRREMRG